MIGISFSGVSKTRLRLMVDSQEPRFEQRIAPFPLAVEVLCFGDKEHDRNKIMFAEWDGFGKSARKVVAENTEDYLCDIDLSPKWQ